MRSVKKVKVFHIFHLSSSFVIIVNITFFISSGKCHCICNTSYDSLIYHGFNSYRVLEIYRLAAAGAYKSALYVRSVSHITVSLREFVIAIRILLGLQ